MGFGGYGAKLLPKLQYNLKDDPGEPQNIAEYPEKAASMEQLIQELMASEGLR
ncbi:hypothetical protein P4E94_03350 [Pontiellaceae bacterium B12219]|nr:hypothetical protein [Pontiellaceae bacterium B12219]